MVTRVLLVAALLLLSVSTASAECAWVLWESQALGTSPIQAYGTMEACIKGLDEFAAETGFIGSGTVRSRVTRSGEYRGQIDYLKCLPDTVDPRGPRR